MMASVTHYTCDRCKEPIEPACGPLRISVDSPMMPVGRDGELCSWACALKWFKAVSKDYGS